MARWAAPLRLLAFLLMLVLAWLPMAALLMWWIADANTVTIATMSLLFVGFLLGIRQWGRRVHKDPRIFQTYGLVWTLQNGRELSAGLGLGLGSLFGLFLVQGWLDWIAWQPISIGLERVVLEGLLTGLGTGFAEELVFRGWILDELERDYGPKGALWINSLLFALLHFLKPIPEIIRTFPQFPGLVLLGLALAWAKRLTQGRLGLPIGLHAGLVWGYYIVHVGALATYTQTVPEWITGIDQNPLAGLVGLALLSGLAAGIRWGLRTRG
ncbi:CPBP family intramembrane glutamic endopeptidase [Thermocoleostomius sinensis]|uniref:CPBP family intramembrane metalloprotease n=1 Tax=Thermocoleostomius sinensis A174 TaxID=2016057 RepID=A0A9E8ZGH9_9CYAN|nr:CPBP family intramembrane glutamic endopeptidase [Thermocoleostomius sinensis]WAL62728.1 CPBP family intramembrane metalloprotease [Thermocoleostomius sinensis A174]